MPSPGIHRTARGVQVDLDVLRESTDSRTAVALDDVGDDIIDGNAQEDDAVHHQA